MTADLVNDVGHRPTLSVNCVTHISMKKENFVIKNRYLAGPLLLLILVVAIACGSVAEPAVEAPANQDETTIVTPVQEAPDTLPEAETVDSAGTKSEEVVQVEADLDNQVDPEDAGGSNEQPEATSGVKIGDQTEPQEPVSEVEMPGQDPDGDASDAAPIGEAADFTAITGLDQFSAYRLNFATSFDGVREGQPSNGSIGGLFEVTKVPEAQHWQVIMDGSAFQQLAILGGKMELYDLGDKIYIQNPQDGSWLGVPAMFVDSFLPADMVTPEDSIELPLTATLQPGQEMVNGMLTQRYTFGAADLAGDSSKYDLVEGSVWVAVDGNYVVKYEAVVDGRHDNLEAGGIKLIDEGTITMRYDISDMNGDFMIEAPDGAQDISLGDLLFNK